VPGDAVGDNDKFDTQFLKGFPQGKFGSSPKRTKRENCSMANFPGEIPSSKPVSTNVSEKLLPGKRFAD